MKTLAALALAGLFAATAVHAQTHATTSGASAPHGGATAQHGAGSPPPSVRRTPNDAEHAPTRKTSAPAGLGQQAGRGASGAAAR